MTSRPDPEATVSSSVVACENSLTPQLQFGRLTFSIDAPLSATASLTNNATLCALPGALVYIGTGFPANDDANDGAPDAATLSSLNDIVFAAILSGEARVSQQGRAEIIA